MKSSRNSLNRLVALSSLILPLIWVENLWFETLDDALHTLTNSGLEYLYLPEYGKLITVKND